MPTYSFRSEDGAIYFDKFFRSWQDKDAWLSENPNMKQVPAVINPISDHKSLDTRNSGDFKDRIKQIKEVHGAT